MEERVLSPEDCFAERFVHYSHEVSACPLADGFSLPHPPTLTCCVTPLPASTCTCGAFRLVLPAGDDGV